MKIAPNAPRYLGGYVVLAATAHPAPTTCWDARTGAPIHFAGTARIVNDDGKQAVIHYDEAHGQVYGLSVDGLTPFARRTILGVRAVARWVHPSTARRQYRDVVGEE